MGAASGPPATAASFPSGERSYLTEQERVFSTTCRVQTFTRSCSGELRRAADCCLPDQPPDTKCRRVLSLCSDGILSLQPHFVISASCWLSAAEAEDDQCFFRKENVPENTSC
ncbi:hypothetical protein NQZ68_000790 [Dissostichus eleginoides]|nr:hypothetical protein NQZ68_000790 [Dissostichus eleginoides]